MIYILLIRIFTYYILYYNLKSDKNKIPRELINKFETDEEKLKSMSKMIENIENELKLVISSVKESVS